MNNIAGLASGCSILRELRSPLPVPQGTVKTLDYPLEAREEGLPGLDLAGVGREESRRGGRDGAEGWSREERLLGTHSKWTPKGPKR